MSEAVESAAPATPVVETRGSAGSWLERLLLVERENPAGKSLDETGEVSALQRQSLGTPEMEVAGQVIPGRPPNWPAIEERAVELLGRSVDIRLLILLAEASLRTGKLALFVDCVQTLGKLVSERWEHWYPCTYEHGELDIEERESALVELRGTRMVNALRAARPFVSPRLKALTFGELAMLDGALPAAAQTLIVAMAEPGIRGEVERIFDLVRAALAAFDDLSTALGKRHMLADCSRVVAVLKGVAETLAVVVAQVRAALATEVGLEASAKAPAHAARTQFSNESARAVLQALIDHYAAAEPSSPIPHYLRRAQSLIGLDFEAVVAVLGDDIRKFGNS